MTLTEELKMTTTEDSCFLDKLIIRKYKNMEQILIGIILNIGVIIITMIFERYRYLNWILHLKGKAFLKELGKAVDEDKRLPQNHINNKLYLFWWAIKTFYV